MKTTPPALTLILLIITGCLAVPPPLMKIEGEVEIPLTYTIGKSNQRGFKGDFMIGYDTVKGQLLKVTSVVKFTLDYDFIFPKWVKSKHVFDSRR